MYSYQYNVKTVGIAQVPNKESSEDTTKISLKLFASIEVDIKIQDIDIAHQVPENQLRPRDQNQVLLSVNLSDD